MQPIFVMSSERSGSNLVRRMLGAHPEVAAPPPPHSWRVLQPLLPGYGPLDGEAAWRALLDDALKLTRVPGSHLEWRHRLEPAEVLPRVRRRSLSGILGALYEAYAAREGARFWVCKENNLFDHAFRIVDVYPEARFIYLARDGRDVACSVRKVPTHDQHVYFIAREWRDEQLRCIGVYQDLLDSGRVRLLRYEELIAEPERELRALCAFLGLSFDARMLSFHEDSESRAEAAKTGFWKNLDKPVMSANRAKFLSELTSAELVLFEAVAGDALELLGYPLQTSTPPSEVRRWRRGLYKLVNRWQSKRKKRRLFDEPGRRERAQVLRELHAQRRDGGAPLAAPIRYDG